MSLGILGKRKKVKKLLTAYFCDDILFLAAQEKQHTIAL